MNRKRLCWAALLVCQTGFLNGCTSVLWDKKTFAHSYEPAHPTNLRLFYSDQQRDVLVQYDEARDGGPPIRHRAYFADQNAERANNQRKPRFISMHNWQSLHPIAITNAPPGSAPAPDLYATSPTECDSFTLYSRGEVLDSYNIPNYVGKSQRVKQIALTPFAVAVDCTIVGGVLVYFYWPYALSALANK